MSRPRFEEASKRSVGLIGFGSIAETAIVPALAESTSDLSITVIVDPRHGALAPAIAAWPRPPRLHGHLWEAIEQERPDVWLVACPTPAHEDALLALSRQPAPVLCEKPLVTSLEQLGRVRDAWAGRLDQLKVVHNYVHTASRQVAARAISDGRIGAWEGTSVRIDAPIGYFKAATPWRLDRPQDLLLDVGYHYFYVAELLAGVPTRRMYDVELVGEGDGRRAAVTLEHVGGAKTRVEISVRPDAPKFTATTVVRGSRGTVTLFGARRLTIKADGKAETLELAAGLHDGYLEMLHGALSGAPLAHRYDGHFENSARILGMVFEALSGRAFQPLSA